MAVVGTGAAVYLALAGQGLAAAAVALAVALVIIVFLKSTRRAELGTGKPRARRDQRPATPVH